MKRGTYILIIFLFFFFMIIATIGAFLYFEFGKPPAIKARSYLEVNLSGGIQEKASPDIFTKLFLGTEPLSMYDLWMNIRKAKADSRVRSILVRLGRCQCDWAKMEEIRNLILDFRESGKKAYAYMDEALDFDKEYYLATACDEIILHPLGTLVINGIGGYVPFIKKALDKLGIQAEFEHVEEYKTAASLFTEERFTPPHKEMMESLYGNMYETYVEGLAKSRGKSPEEIRAIINLGFYQGEKALETGLVDHLLFEDELEALLNEDGKKTSRLSFTNYTKISASSLGLNKGKKIAVIYGMGPIHTGESSYMTMGSTTVARWIRKVRKDSNIKAVVFRVDSPGGSAVGSDIIWREVILTKKSKPIVVSMSDVAGSGGYWVAMGANKIFAQPQTLTGSIGVVSGKFDMSQMYKKLGITAERLIFGDRADMFTTFRSLTPEERTQLKKEIVWIYDRFLEKVAEGRGMTTEDVNSIGRGRVWTGSQARELGLVDEIGGLSQAIASAKELAGIPAGEEVRLVVWPKKVSMFDILLGRTSAQTKLFDSKWDKLFSVFKLLKNDTIWALMPFWLAAE